MANGGRERLVFDAVTVSDMPHAANIYTTIQELNLGMPAGRENRFITRAAETTKDNEVTRYTQILIDADPVRDSKVSATDEEKAYAFKKANECREWLRSQFGIQSILADSGNGIHQRIPVDLPNTPENVELVRRVLLAISARFTDDRVVFDTTVFNPARICKLYGTVARKGENTAERPHRLSRVLDVPANLKIVPREILQKIAGEYTFVVPESSPALENAALQAKIDDMEGFLNHHGIEFTVKQNANSDMGGILFILQPCPFDADHTGSSPAISVSAAGVYGFNCKHNGCVGNNWKKLRNHIDPSHEYKFQRPASEFDDVEWVGAAQSATAQSVVSTKPATAPTTAYDKLHTEVGNARRLLDAYGRDLRFHVERDTWLVWDGRYWVFDPHGRKVAILMKHVIQKMRDGAVDVVNALAGEVDKIKLLHPALKNGTQTPFTKEESEVLDKFDAAEATIKWSKTSESDRVVNGAIRQAASDPHRDIRIHTYELDTNLMLFNVLNGTYNLDTNTLQEHRREDFLTKIAPVTFDPNAVCFRFDAFMDEIFPSRQRTVEYLQRLGGYTLTGLTILRVLPFLMGEGANGKSVLMNILLGIFGTASDNYGMEAAFSTFLMGKFTNPDQPRNDIMRFEGKRLITACESDDASACLDTNLLKRLSGDDHISGRGNYQEDKQFKPQAKVFLRLNNEVRIEDTTDSIWQRVKKVPFTEQFQEDDPRCDPFLTQKLDAEKSGILNWLIRGWKLVQAAMANHENPIPPPPEVAEATTAYRQAQSQVSRFFQETYRVADGEVEPIPASDVYAAYALWVGKSGEKVKKNTTVFGTELAKYLKRYGVRKDQHKNRMHWFGIEPLVVVDAPEVRF